MAKGYGNVSRMSVALAHPSSRLTVDEYLTIPDPADGARYELADGELRLMSPTTNAHGIICGNLNGALHAHIKKRRLPCFVMQQPGIRPRVNADYNARIPDLGIACNPVARDARFVDEPVVLIEVLSPSNERDTRGNVYTYTTIPSVAEILVVASAARKAEIYRRQADGVWAKNPEIIGANGMIRLDSIGFTLAMNEAYENVSFLTDED